MRILVTGAAGFIGSFLAKSLAQNDSNTVLAIDSFAPYYSPELKMRRLAEVLTPNVEFRQIDICERQSMERCFEEFHPEQVFHLAAQPGIRLDVGLHSQYVDANLTGFCNILNASQRNEVKSFLYASSSSVYGNVDSPKLREDMIGLSPTSFYGATKLSNEVLASSYSLRYGMRTRGLRFFTVYGPWGRPDMSYFRIMASLLLGREFTLFGDGSIERDFTFIDDVTELTVKLGQHIDSQEDGFFDFVNIGGGNPLSINEVIRVISSLADSELAVRQKGADPSDVAVTNADSSYLEALIGKHVFRSHIEGLTQAWNWASQVNHSDLAAWMS